MNELNAADEQAITDAIATYHPVPSGLACACVGAPPGCTICYCHIHSEAEARIKAEPCRWCYPEDSEK